MTDVVLYMFLVNIIVLVMALLFRWSVPKNFVVSSMNEWIKIIATMAFILPLFSLFTGFVYMWTGSTFMINISYAWSLLGLAATIISYYPVYTSYFKN